MECGFFYEAICGFISENETSCVSLVFWSPDNFCDTVESLRLKKKNDKDEQMIKFLKKKKKNFT